MAQLVACSPNFSEGCRGEVITAIVDAMKEISGCWLLDANPDDKANRTVYTIVGQPDAVVNAVISGAKVAKRLINMERQSGDHPRIGALDVCPFKPVKGMSKEACVECSRAFAERLSSELAVPVYLYELSSTQEHRKTLAQIREGEYEGLPDKIVRPEWKPDFGPAQFISSWGATVTGARCYSLNYNINLLATKEQANRIALNIREEGRSPDQPGRLKGVKAQGRLIPERRIAQISVTVTDPETTPIHVVYEECLKDAKGLRIAVIGSQLEGMVPLSAIISAADYFIHKDDLFIIDEEQKIRLAIERLGLDSFEKFDPKSQIIEYIIDQGSSGAIVSLSVRGFIETVAGRSYTPGGLAVAATAAALGSSLATMSGWMTFGLKRFENLEMTMRELIPPLTGSTEELMKLMDLSHNDNTTTRNQCSRLNNTFVTFHPLLIISCLALTVMNFKFPFES
jgi:glutamate formiminotransferase/formiminotetrahydrofolate cyclodeaminase